MKSLANSFNLSILCKKNNTSVKISGVLRKTRPPPYVTFYISYFIAKKGNKMNSSIFYDLSSKFFFGFLNKHQF